jgi:hypothetical protein
MPRRLLWPVALVAVGLLAALILGPNLPGPRLLWREAILLEQTDGRLFRDFIPSGYDHVPRQAAAWFWRSESELTCLQPGADGSVDWIDVNLSTHQRSQGPPGPWLQPPPANAEPFFWRVSPNGHWWLQVGRRGPDRIYAVMLIDGTSRATWTNRYESHTHPEWLSDSSGFVEWPIREGQLLARVHWLDHRTTTEVQLNQLSSVATPPGIPLPQPFVPMTRSPRAPGVAMEFLVLEPTHDPAAWFRRRLSLPEALAEHTEVQVYPAPTGDHLAWLAHDSSRIPTVHARRGFPYLTFEPAYRTTLLLSQADGSRLQTLGRTPTGRTIEWLQWTPDATRISFVYADQLWIQAVPDP